MNLEGSIEKIQSDETKLFGLLSKLIQNKQMIDVGAHQGDTLKPFLVNGWKVHAFEPIESNRNRIVQKYGNRDNLIIRSEAVSSTSGTKDFHLALNNDGSLHEYYHSLENIKDDNYHCKGETIRIQTASINDLIERGELPKSVGFLKIDTEGHDLEILKAAADLECDAISVEFWCEQHTLGSSPSPPEEMIKLLAERGFKHFILFSREGNYKICYLYSSLAGLSRNSWGNIVFYKDIQEELYKESVKFCKSLEAEKTSYKSSSSVLKILKNIFSKSELFFIDVGAYQGDFTATLLENFPNSTAMLFEPTPESYKLIQERFKKNKSIQIFNYALSDEEGIYELYLTPDPATNSLLYPNDISSAKISVTVQTIDNVFKQLGKSKDVNLIKVDTQGNDLKVLHGASNIIKRFSPIILVESIFIELYQNQCSYYEILGFMKSCHYYLAGIYNSHYTETGMLAFSDLLFIPKSLVSKVGSYSNNFTCFDLDYLIEQNKFLQSACEDRLRLINDLTRVAEERLDVIKVLDAEVKRLNEEIKSLCKKGNLWEQ